MLSRYPATPGIYRITCIVTDKFYIGSAINLRMRWTYHLKELRRNNHANQKLQHAFNKYGEDAFTFEVIELVLIPELLTAREQYWFKKLKPFDNKGFNIAREAGSNLGLKRSLESRAKMSTAKRGKQFRLGKKLSLESRAKIGAAGLGRKDSEATRQKRRASALKRLPATKAQACANLRLANAKRMRILIVTAPDGTEQTITGILPFCREHGLHASSLIKVAQGKRSHTGGWKARYSDVS